MAKNFVQVGENLTLPVASNIDIKSGELVQVGDVIGIALTDAKTDDGTNYYTTIATKGVWNLALKMNTKVGGVVSATPKNVSKNVSNDVSKDVSNGTSNGVPVGFALEDATYSDTDIVVPVLLCLGLAYGTTNSVGA